MSTKPLLKLSHNLIINASPEIIFPYLTDPDKIIKWQSYEYGQIFSIENHIEYAEPDKELGVGTKFIKHMNGKRIYKKISSPGQEDMYDRENFSDNFYGVIMDYQPPYMIGMLSSRDGKGLFKTVTYDRYTLTHTTKGTKLSILSEVSLQSTAAREAQAVASGILIKLISISNYIFYWVIKKIFIALFQNKLKEIMNIGLYKLKQECERV